MLLFFSASWCGPCIRMKKDSLTEASVAAELVRFTVIFVDLDEHPQLATTYGVASVPDVFLIAGDGVIVDRLQNYVGPQALRERLLRVR